jgi:hypothetical protein
LIAAGAKADVDLIAFIGLAKAMPLLQSLLFDAPKEFFRSLFSR